MAKKPTSEADTESATKPKTPIDPIDAFIAERGARQRTVLPMDSSVLDHYLQLRQRSVTAIGETVLAMIATERYRNQSVGNLRDILVEPMLRDRVVLAMTRPPEGNTKPFLPQTSIAIWASVSAEVDARISQQAAANVFPIFLKPEEWVSGDIVWLLDVIAPSAALTSAVIGQFRKVANTSNIKMHPAILRMIPAELLAELLGAARAAQASRPQT